MYKSKIYVILLAIVFSCETVDSTYYDFVKDGIKIYVEKPKQAHLHGGDNRAIISWVILSDPNVESYKIYWNNKADSLGGTVERSMGVDTVEVLVEPVEEKFHQFDIMLFDKYGNSSLSTSCVGFVYGDLYRESIKNLNRPYKEINSIADSNDYEITWTDVKDKTLVYSLIYYRDTTNVESQIRIPSSSEVDTLRAVDSNQDLRIQTAYLPDTLAVDTFFTDIKLLKHID